MGSERTNEEQRNSMRSLCCKSEYEVSEPDSLKVLKIAPEDEVLKDYHKSIAVTFKKVHSTLELLRVKLWYGTLSPW